MIVALPALPPVTIPFASAVATVVFDDEYVTFEDSVTSRMLPSEKVPSRTIGNCSPRTSRAIPEICAETAVGRSGRSTSIRIVADCRDWPDDVTPKAVSMYVLQAMSPGIVRENVAGTALAAAVGPMGS